MFITAVSVSIAFHKHRNFDCLEDTHYTGGLLNTAKDDEWRARLLWVNHSFLLASHGYFLEEIRKTLDSKMGERLLHIAHSDSANPTSSGVSTAKKDAIIAICFVALVSNVLILFL